MKNIFLLFIILSSAIAFGQNDYYTAPVKIPMFLSGSFAELRSNHFHSGIDIKTQGVTGHSVFAVADGYISRIVISPGGYGNALYINHPNGTTSVYGHLKSFRKDIDKYLKEKQYEKKSFRVDIQIPRDKFPVKQNDEIAKSGNSGSSGGPHLHFEIRDTKSEKPLNPLKYSFEIKDTIPPKVLSLMIVPLGEKSHVKHETRNRRFPIVFYDGKYHIKGNPTVPMWGEIGFAIEANDYFNGTWNKCGIYSIQLTVDDELYFSNKLDQFSFDESRYINSFIEYESYIELNRRFQKTWVEPGNKLSTYNYIKENGAFIAKENGIQKVKVLLKDSYNNTTTLEFNVEGKHKEIVKPEEEFVARFEHDQKNRFETDNFKIDIPENVLYSSINFEYKTIPISPGYYSDIHIIHKNTVPVHKNTLIKIKAKNLPPELESKVLMVTIDDNTGKYWAAGGKFEKGWVSSNIGLLGQYAVKVDTISPTIKPLSIKANKKLTELNQIRFEISDDLAGIEKIEGYLDGKWALFEYDAKSSLITHYFDKGRFDFNKNHHLVLNVSDYRNNTTKYEANFWK